ncbi:MAG TPA: peptide chain release factor 3, partial [Runella sp.]|nr:peptide chain release factor 3 [Runella sp.]
NKTKVEDDVALLELDSSELDQKVGERDANQLREDVELIEGVYDTFNRDTYLSGKVAPVFFGSAVINFGVRERLEAFCQISPLPAARPTNVR